MISVTGPTDRYILQPRLINMHQESLEWLSATVLWKNELNFLQKLLDDHASLFVTVDEKKEIDHYQNLIIYYNGEVIDAFRKKLRKHENGMAAVLQSRDETGTEYFKVHEGLMDELRTFGHQFSQLKNDFFSFIEKVM